MGRISIGKEITSLARQIRLLRNRCLDEEGCIIGEAQFHAFMHFARNEGSSEKHAAASVGVDKTLMARTVKKLSALELVEVRRDQRDSRYKQVWLTAEGKAELDRVKAALAKITDTLAQGITHQQLKVFLDILAIIKENATERLK